MRRFTLIAALTLFIPAAGAQVAPFTFHYEFDQPGVLPSNTPNVALGNYNGYPSNWLWDVSCGRLEQKTGSYPVFGSFFYGGSFPGYPATAVVLNPVFPVVLEARFRALLLAPGPGNVTTVLAAHHGANVQLVIDTVNGLIGCSTSSGFATATVPGGLGIPHTYRIEAYPSGGSTIATLYIDGSATIGPVTAPVTTNGANGWLFGDAAGSSLGANLDWDYVTIINGSTGGIGQRNSGDAALFVNRATNTEPGAPGLPGPFGMTAPANSVINLEWNGPAGMPFALYAGPPFPAAGNFGCVGLADIGTPPFFPDIVTVFDPFMPFFGSLFFLNACGYAQQTLLVPSLPPSTPIANIQGAVFQPGGCPVILTAAFYLSA